MRNKRIPINFVLNKLNTNAKYSNKINILVNLYEINGFNDVKFILKNHMKAVKTSIINYRNTYNFFCELCIKGYKDFIDFMIDNHLSLISIDKVNSNNDTVMHVLCEHGKLDIIQHLINKNNDNILKCLTSKNNNGDTPLNIACQYKQVECIKYISDMFPDQLCVKNDKKLTPICNLMLSNNIICIEYILSGNNLQNKNFIFLLACKLNKNAIVEYILSNNLLTDYKCEDNDGNNALHISLLSKSNSIFILLTSKYIDYIKDAFIIPNNSSITPLHILCETGNDFIKNLVINHKDLLLRGKDCIDMFGFKPFSLLFKRDHIDIITILLKEHFEFMKDILSTPDINGFTPLYHLSKVNKNSEEIVLKLLCNMYSK